MELQREALIDVAMGYEPADTVITNGRVVNVHTGTIKAEGIAIKGERIAAVGDVDYSVDDKTVVIDAEGRFLVPGLIDPHCHQWHTYANSTVFAACRLLHGSTTIVDGFYGHAIVNGMRASRYFLHELLATPVKPIFVTPTMCYTQNRGIGFPASPNAPSIEDLRDSLTWPETKGIEEISPELMLYRNQRDRALLSLMEEALDMGMIAAGRFADIVFVDTLEGFEIDRVMANGKVWVEGGKLIAPLQNPDYPDWLYGTMNIDRVLKPEDFRIEAPAGAGDTVKVQCINTRDGSLETPGSVETLRVVDGCVEADPGNGINKICMIDRIMGTGEVGVAFVKGFGIKDGYIGTTANVFNQNIVLVGASDEDMAAAANETITMDGGFIALRNDTVEASLPTPLNGLASDLPFDELFERQYKPIDAWRDMGCELETPQMNLEFVSLVTIPYYRISTKGLAYMTQDRFELAELFVD